MAEQEGVEPEEAVDESADVATLGERHDGLSLLIPDPSLFKHPNRPNDDP